MRGSGGIFIEGKKVEIRSAQDAMGLGIGFIHQELNVLENVDVAGNIFLGREPTNGGPLRLIDRGAIDRGSVGCLERLGLRVSPRTPLKELSLAQQQMVEIAKALSQDARLLIMDEPTSCLTLSETEQLLKLIGELKRSGVSVIYISHRLGEIEVCADRVVALRDGRNAGGLKKEEINHEAMVKLMVGRELKGAYVAGSGAKRTERKLVVRNLRTKANPHRTLNFEAVGGEILGFAGLVGAGRSEMAEAVFGVEAPLEGEVLLDGKVMRIRHAKDAIGEGIYLVTEDRRRTALVTEMTVRENISLAGLWRYTVGGLVRRGAEARRWRGSR